MSGRSHSQGEFGSEYAEANMCFPGEVRTPFATGETIDSMKAMLADAQPATVLSVADAWKNLHDHLVDGGASVKGDFDKAVQHILEHWEGESADEFAKKAQKISKQIADCAKYASHTSIAMRNAGERLNDIKPKVDAVEKPGDVDSALNSLGDGFSRDDSKWRGEIDGNQGAQSALDNHHDDLSAGREEQLRAAALMETLALTYSSQAKTMGSWQRRTPGRDETSDYPGDPGGVAPVPVIVTPSVGGPSAAAPSRGSTVTPGAGGGTPKSTSPHAPQGVPTAGTRLDSVTTTAPGNGGTPVNPGGGRGVPSGGPVGGPTGGVPGGPGLVGRASGNRGIPAGAPGGTGGGAPVSRGGAGAGAAQGGRASAGSSGRGPLARQRGGTADMPRAGNAADRQGGQGLHSSRGGTQAGQRGSHVTGAMRGGGAATGRGRDEKESEGQRPDYLVEDEETWMPKRRNVAPPTVD